MLHRPLIAWLSRLLSHPLRIPFSLFSLFKKAFTSITDFTPFQSLFATLRTPKKKALLIGICGTRSASINTLKGPHKDVNSMRSLLLEVYTYAPNDITILVDDGNPDHIQPTKINILQAIDDLVRGARSGDRFCFHFAGHAGQVPTDDPGEEDGMDEFIVASDGKKILDDTLHERLIKPLPVNSTLTAVMDSCHSCSLLDLKHYKCNQVWVPWISKGKRKMKTYWATTVRKAAMWWSISQSQNSIHNHSADTSPYLPSVKVVESSTSSAIPPTAPLSIRTSITHISEAEFVTSPIEEFASPQNEFCDGFKCRQSSLMSENICADVVCLSSSQDSQKTWEDGQGVSMSQILIELLREDANPVLSIMMQHINHKIHDIYVKLHDEAREYRRKVASWEAKKALTAASAQINNRGLPPRNHPEGQPTVSFERPQPQPQKLAKKKKKSLSLEMINFQDPALSSPIPLEIDTRKWDM